MYPFGIDPMWKGALNDVEFSNSLKKKLAIVLGVAHMFVSLAQQWQLSLKLSAGLLVWHCPASMRCTLHDHATFGLNLCLKCRDLFVFWSCAHCIQKGCCF